jgi:hypothetical protein
MHNDEPYLMAKGLSTAIASKSNGRQWGADPLLFWASEFKSSTVMVNDGQSIWQPYFT